MYVGDKTPGSYDDVAPSSRRTIGSNADDGYSTGKGYLWDRKRLQLEKYRKHKSQRTLNLGTGTISLPTRLSKSERTPLMVRRRDKLI
jgi:hypothetical protein